jgi:hypothetical protein
MWHSRPRLCVFLKRIPSHSHRPAQRCTCGTARGSRRELRVARWMPAQPYLCGTAAPAVLGGRAALQRREKMTETPCRQLAQPHPCGTAPGLPGKPRFWHVWGVRRPRLCSVEERPFRAVKRNILETPLPYAAGRGQRQRSGCIPKGAPRWKNGPSGP